MSVDRTDEAKEIVERVLRVKSKRLRAVLIDTSCGGDDALRARVDELLQEAKRGGGAMTTATSHDAEPPDDTHEPGAADADAAADAADVSEGVGDHIGPYKLLQQIGEGGFGIVYMAEQHEPVRRTVALKIIKLGMDTKQVIARFEAERQALALMDHPCIARVLDAGATDVGRPYFVMELVRGEPITDYCDKHKLSVPERLKLFQHVCEAVQHAHQKGIIHRDLKPSNVMVTLHDGGPVPKVIDFGIAKATDQRLTEKTMFTQHRQMIGTPAYMSPEQAEMSGLDIDTRTDVYALGVLLYELLTGTTPFDIEALRSAGYAEIQRIIREDTPHKPSTRISTLDTLDTIAASRRAEPKKLGMLIRGDLDWIVMKAMEKDRVRRYESASEFAADVQRYLDDEPVVASPPSAAYRVRKFIRRNRGGVAVAGLLAGALVLGAFGTTWGMVRALNEKERADRAAEDATLAAAAEREANEAAQAAARDARNAEVTARRRADELERVTAFQAEQLSDIDLPLMGLRIREELIAKVRASAENTGSTPDAVSERIADLERLIAGTDFTGIAQQTLEQIILVRALETIDTQFDDQPLVQARLLQSVADSLREFGSLEMAAEPQSRAVAIRETHLGREHAETLESLRAQAILTEMSGRYEEAEAMYNVVLETCRRVLGEAHPQTLSSMNDLGVLYRKTERYDEAESMYLAALEGRKQALGEDHPVTLATMSNLTSVYRDQRRFDDAEELGRETVDRALEVLGEEDAITLAAMTNLDILYRRQRRYDDAEPLYERVLEIQQRVRGFEHPSTLSTMNNLVSLYRDQDRYDEAEALAEQTVEIMGRILGEEHPTTLIVGNNLALVYQAQDRLDDAAAQFESIVERRTRALGADNGQTLYSMTSLGNVYEAQDRLDEAESLFQVTLGARRRTLGDDHRDTLASLARLGRVLVAQEKYDEAESALRESHEGYVELLGDSHRMSTDILTLLALSIAGQGEFEDAEAMLIEAHDAVEDGNDAAARRAVIIEQIVEFYERWHQADEDAGAEDKAAEWRAKLADDETDQDGEGDDEPADGSVMP